MADNFSFTEGSGKTGAADDIGGVLYPRVKIAQGADGSATDVSSAAPLQVSLANHGANATAVKVDGSAVTQPVSHTALTELAAAIDTEVQVDVVGALPAGTNNIGDVDIASIAAGDNNIGNVDIASIAAGDNNIGNVDVATLPADPLGANADAAATAGSTGSISAKLRLATSQLDSIKTAVENLDNAIAGSEMQVDIVSAPTLTVNSHAVTNAGTFAVQVDGSALTALQKIDDPVLVDDAAFTPGTSSVMVAGFQADETATDSVDEGDVGAARMTLDRKQHVVAEQETDTIRVAGTAYTVKRAAIVAASSGENTLVAAVASKKIRVLSIAVISAAANNIYFNNATDGAVFGGSTNKIQLAANGGFVLPHNPHGWFQTGTNNEALRANLSAASAVSGGLTYIEV
ncbi:MAG: hypothetical protein KF889_01575 [Alphaproteobacteria bacterium]|nr:hypothetical protein [Alphaproteobacteria bacterium]MCW5741595.1 hypothetical protein [Alphaproteobacteria bacterium]